MYIWQNGEKTDSDFDNNGKKNNTSSSLKTFQCFVCLHAAPRVMWKNIVRPKVRIYVLKKL